MDSNYFDVDTTIPTLGEAKIPAPVHYHENGEVKQTFISEKDKVLIDVNPYRIAEMIKNGKEPPAFEKAGPREMIYFDPSKLRCALVTCGGLCPGLNDIIRSIVLALYYRYGVRNIYGIRYGLQGFIPKYKHDILELTPDAILHILEIGGSILGSSRGPQSIDEIVDSLERMGIGALFMIGGDGTLKAAIRIADAISERGLKISVVGVPKTIDNDIYMVSRSFGFDTAVDVATLAIKSAHNESSSYVNGIGLIKLMGRYSGFIAATSVLAQQDVNFVLIPEIDFDIDGPNGFIAALEKRLLERKHAVIVVAEGAGQKFVKSDEEEVDASGNIKLNDFASFLKDAILKYFESKKTEISLKYIDPSYIIRSLPANANDHVFCSFLGRDAVHAAMAGKTKLLVGSWSNNFVHIPMVESAKKRKQVNPNGKLWQSVLEATGQGPLKNKR